ncbi:MAG: GTPase [Chloroflexota bacterium]|jgi:GTP-binding protein|nr:GTPase [Chloroflexota bacterium]
MFLDQVSLTVTAGRGGDGAATFRHEAHVPHGGPDGGDGGRGGSVSFVVDVGQTTLGDYRFKHHFRAGDGGRGEGSRRHGKQGKDLDLPVPPGTLIVDAKSGDLLADLVVPGQRFTVAKGGSGGMGNVHFKTSTHQAPKHATKGLPGDVLTLRLDLRLIADVGLVGLPNAGKSTLLAALTAATPKVADYPFTTLEPNLGVLDLEALDPTDHRRPTLADLPGLIEGASGGAGLGDAFLRHVERTRVLVHVVDLAAPNPERDFQIIREELEARDPGLLQKTTLVVANKLDLPAAAANLKPFQRARKKQGLEVVPISARETEGFDQLLDALARLLPDQATLASPGEPVGVVIHRVESAGTGFAVERELDGAYRVRGRGVERLVAQTDFENEESAERFQRALGRMGIERELRKQGVETGDLVRIGPHELEWGADWA